MFIHQLKLLLSFPRISDFFFTEKHTMLSSEKSFMNITFLLNFLINSKQLMIFTINANVLSSKKFFMNIRFLKNSLINTDIFNFSNVLFFLTQIYLPLMKSTRKLIIAKKANIYLPALRFKIYILYQNVCCQSGYV